MKTNVASKQYDAVMVLGMNIVPDAASGFRPTTYKDHDQYGMLAGEMGVIAAALLFKQGVTDTFVFSTGTSEKTKALYGPDVPTEAEVYSNAFLARIKNMHRSMPIIIQEKRSVNTYSNLTECIKVINEHDWRNVAVLVARYHVPRVQALWELARKNQHTASATVAFLTAEAVITDLLPGAYDQKITAAYATTEGQKRLENEAQGLRDIQAGKYVATEFQLLKRD